MEELSKNDLYQKIKNGFKSAPFEESMATTQGFLLGLITRGHTCSDNKALEITINILNGGTNLSGSGIALFTTMMIELERELKEHKVKFFVSSQKEGSGKERISQISEIAYGFVLALCCENQPIVGSIVEEDYPQKNALLQENIEFLNEVANLDSESECDEESFELVYNQTRDIIHETYTLFNPDASASCAVKGVKIN